VYEAMALVHSRVRRVIFGIVDNEVGGLGGASDSANSQNTGIHSLPGTNHHYRAFKLDTDKGKYDKKTVTLIESVVKVHNTSIA
jgi:tRNA(Arg) A34 adenosine deaminase TadA